MKKLFDRYLFSRMGLQIGFSVVAILVFSFLLTFIKNNVTPDVKNSTYSHLSWGFRQLADGGSVTQTLEDLDNISSQNGNVFIVLVLALVSWLIGMILCGFVTGAIVNAFDGRKDKIKSGQARYKFKNHGLIIGWDYQGVAVVQDMFSQRKLKEILIVSETPAEEITAVLSRSLSEAEMANIFIYNCSVNINDNIKTLQAEFARVIVILGEQNKLDKDGEAFRTERMLQKYVREKIQASSNKKFKNLPIKLYLHIEDTVLYTQARSKKDGFVEDEIFDIELCNFYESWAWRCWSKVGAVDCDYASSGREYLPLRYKKDSQRVEVFVIGSDSMAHAFINYAIPLLNYGEDNKHCKVTLFDDNSNGDIYLPKKHLIESLPEVDVVCRHCNGGSDEANDIMYEAIQREDTSVTIIIAVPGVEAAVKAYAALSYEIRRQKVSVLVRQSTDTSSCVDKDLLQISGDCAELRYFGMTNILPWTDGSRDEYGRNINYSYGIVSEAIKQTALDAKADPEKLFEVLKLALEHPFGDKEIAQAEQQWCGIKRWKRWSSISAGDCFKERAFAVPDCAESAESCIIFLRAEHNRWWTERLLAGWFFGVRDDEKFQHPFLVEFDRLDAATQALDLLGIVAMKNAGLLK